MNRGKPNPSARGIATTVVGPDGQAVDYRVLAAELARAAEYFLRTADLGLDAGKARGALERVVTRYKAGTFDGLSDLRRAVHAALFQLRTIAHKLPPEAKRILQELAATAQKYEDRR
jgi:hypothetical protein